ncbi:four-helix bundle copper-binding protein [Kribbella albertanoniae]|uniref:Four-helix bundle copper-binding protein n=1 Tax=Kribbella albertanoniae TaxID=1266829 RepID=A0A4R4QIA7_9ACTN|nr:four-helix bundle copper-binding protein [Kribbella albertanoniae]TDC35003.1 four-helix bundle copper-binding protein [Kribbella albertanoniae]
MSVQEMIESYPAQINLDRNLLADAVEALLECAQACTACADACLSEQEVDPLRKCIRTDLDCADICETTARVVSRHTAYDAVVTRALLQTCIQACTACGDQCRHHAEMHEHCRICSEACQRCSDACQSLLSSIN